MAKVEASVIVINIAMARGLAGNAPTSNKITKHNSYNPLKSNRPPFEQQANSQASRAGSVPT